MEVSFLFSFWLRGFSPSAQIIVSAYALSQCPPPLWLGAMVPILVCLELIACSQRPKTNIKI